MKTIYESHIPETKQLPFIFHLDTVGYRGCGNESIANWHENIEILYFIEGSGKVLCDMQLIDAKAGDIVVINANCLHKVQSDTTVRYYCLIIDHAFCLYHRIDTEKMIFQNQIRDENAVLRYQSIIDAFYGEERFRMADICRAALDFLVYIARFYAADEGYRQRDRGAITLDNIKLGINYIRAHFTERLTVETIANEAGLSKYYFSRIFKEITGCTVVTYINMLRCRYARRLLETRGYSICDVAEICGFQNLSYFTRTYKKYIGQLPSEFLLPKG